MEIFFSSIYHYIYLLIVAFATLFYLPVYTRQRSIGAQIGNSSTNSDKAVFLLVFLILFVGLRPINGYFVDMSAYDYMLRRHGNTIFEFNWDTDNKIFDNFIAWFGSRHFERKIFFLIMSTLYFGCMYLGLKRLFPDNLKLAFLTYLGGLSTFAYATNGIKAGVAASFFILALSYYDKKKICALLMLISLGFHHSMVMPIAACIVVFFFKNAKWYYWIWVFCLIMCILHISYFQSLFAGYSDEQGAYYLNATNETTTAHIGFRPDFILYSAMPVLLGYIYEIKRKQKLSRKFQFLMHFYLLTNAIWMLCMYASFNNRIAYLSWFVYPIVIIAPFLDKFNTDPMRYKKLANVVTYQLMFTLFMFFVYYGIFRLGR